MDLRYQEYLSPNTKFYKENYSKKRESRFKIQGIPNNWINKLDDSEHWHYIMQKKYLLPPQGWKIHISSTIEQAQQTLNIVSEILFKMNISFKFVDNKWELFLKNSKYGDRSSSGKFITIYPSTIYVFYTLLDSLSAALRDMDPGTYILNDDRWLNSNVYFRYGGFLEMYTDSGEPAILNEKNILIPDKRLPQFIVPSFVEIPNKIQKMEKKKLRTQKSSKRLDRYSIIDVIHFSNGGGVYEAIDHGNSDQHVILKEGRPGAGLDSNGVDGFGHIDVEAKILKQLTSISGVVNYVENFYAWEHNFLVEELIQGVPLDSWLTQSYPFSSESIDDEKVKRYKNSAIKILNSLITTIKQVHEKGIGIGDISVTNILVNKQDLSIKLIDFETGGDVDENYKPSLQTPGFSTPYANTRRKADNFSLARVALFLFYPSAQIQDIDMKNEVKIDNWINYFFGLDIKKKVNELENNAYIPFKNVREEKDKGYLQKNIDCSSVSNFYVRQMITGIRNGIIENASPDKDYLIPGDIRQHELEGGKLNVLTGGFGVVLSLLRSGKVPSNIEDWVRKFLKEKYTSKLPSGLFNGKAGVASVLYELGYVEEAEQMLLSINYKDMDSISLFSGLSGIGLAFLGMSKKDTLFVNKAIEIANKIYKVFKTDRNIESIDEDFVNGGLIDGWSGSVMFLVALYKTTKSYSWILIAEKMMDEELKHCLVDEDGILLLDDSDSMRLLPYIMGGSTGVAIALNELQKYSSKEVYTEKLKQISGITRTKCTYNIGLFRGYAGLVTANTLFVNIFKKNYHDNFNLQFRTLETMLFYGDKQNSIMCPGDFGYRYSGDLFSGSAGVLLTLQGYLTNNWLLWLPIPLVAIKELFTNKKE
jgi:serine/threonine protein kinase